MATKKTVTAKPLMKGVDVSYWQQGINYAEAKKDIDFVIPRTGYSLANEDKYFMTNVKNALANGVKVPGVYHFSYAASIADAKKEAEFACSLVKKAGLPSDTIIFFDYEYDSASYAEKHGGVKNGYDKTFVTSLARSFCEMVTKKGYVPGVYFNIDFYVRVYDHDFLDTVVRWLADWNGDPDFPCEFHQYSSTGWVQGMHNQGQIDLDYFYGDALTKATTSKIKTVAQLATEVFDGKWSSGIDRQKLLNEAGYNYKSVQAEINNRIQEKSQYTTAIAKMILNDTFGTNHGKALEDVISELRNACNA